MSVTADHAVAETIDAHPSAGARLIVGGAGREGVRRYLGSGGYQPVGDAGLLLEEVSGAGVLGRGGAAFPAAIKIRAVRERGPAPVVVANGEEGEPASVKDRWLMRTRPHLVLDGLRLAAAMCGATDLHLYVSDPVSARSMKDALREATDAGVWRHPVTVTLVDPAYVAGEETAVVRALGGGPALPSDKPPRPFEEGVAGRPTLVSNVETLANLPLVRREGAANYRAVGTEESPGTFLMTLSVAGSAGLVELAHGLTLREVLTWQGHDPGAVGGVLMGGYFSGVLGPHVLDVPLAHETLRAIGSGLGCGAVSVFDARTCPVAVSAAVLTYFDRENAGQCGSCFNGTAAMAAVAEALVDGRADGEDIDRLGSWSAFLRGRGACGTLDGATNVAASLLREFPEQVDRHLMEGCAGCAADARPSYPPFAAGLPSAPWPGEETR